MPSASVDRKLEAMQAPVPTARPRAIVLMGPSASGKTTVGMALAAALDAPFLDADAEHTPENIDKMHRGEPLTDADRHPWLQRLHAHIQRALAAGVTMVMACSALRQSYRDILAGGDARVAFVYLEVPPDVLADRLATRRGHFAGPSLLRTQLSTFERPDDAIAIDGVRPIAEQVAAIRAAIGM